MAAAAAAAAPAPVELKFESTVILSSHASAALVPLSRDQIGDSASRPIDAFLFPIHFAASVWPLVDGQGPLTFDSRPCHCGQAHGKSHLVCDLPLNFATYLFGAGHSQMLWMTNVDRRPDKIKQNKDSDQRFSCNPADANIPPINLILPPNRQKDDVIALQAYHLFRLRSSTSEAPVGKARTNSFAEGMKQFNRLLFEENLFKSANTKVLRQSQAPCMSFPLGDLSTLPTDSQVRVYAEFLSEFLFGPFSADFGEVFKTLSYSIVRSSQVGVGNACPRPTWNLVVNQVITTPGGKDVSDVPYLAMMMAGGIIWAQRFAYVTEKLTPELKDFRTWKASTLPVVMQTCIDLFRQLLCQVLNPDIPEIHEYIENTMHTSTCEPLARHLPVFLRRFLHPLDKSPRFKKDYAEEVSFSLRHHVCSNLMQHAEAHLPSKCCSTNPYHLKVQCFCLHNQQQLDILLTKEVFDPILNQ